MICKKYFQLLSKLSHHDISRVQIHFLYQYSLHFFLDTYHTVLYENASLKGISDHTQRLDLITKDLFQVRRRRCTFSFITL